MILFLLISVFMFIVFFLKQKFNTKLAATLSAVLGIVNFIEVICMSCGTPVDN